MYVVITKHRYRVSTRAMWRPWCAIEAIPHRVKAEAVECLAGCRVDNKYDSGEQNQYRSTMHKVGASMHVPKEADHE